MSKDDCSINFGLGLLIGIIGGVAAGILLAPKPGETTRKELIDTVETLNEKYSPELKEVKKQALSMLDITKCRLENRILKISNGLKAKKLAKAKRFETKVYDFN